MFLNNILICWADFNFAQLYVVVDIFIYFIQENVSGCNWVNI
jgi:hypothetical protein